MEVRIKALDSFRHDRLDAHRDQEYNVPNMLAEMLIKVGLAQAADAPQTGATDSQEAPASVDDLVGGEKAAPTPENKMEDDPKNKAAKK